MKRAREYTDGAVDGKATDDAGPGAIAPLAPVAAVIANVDLMRHIALRCEAACAPVVWRVCRRWRAGMAQWVNAQTVCANAPTAAALRLALTYARELRPLPIDYKAAFVTAIELRTMARNYVPRWLIGTIAHRGRDSGTHITRCRPPGYRARVAAATTAAVVAARKKARLERAEVAWQLWRAADTDPSVHVWEPHAMCAVCVACVNGARGRRVHNVGPCLPVCRVGVPAGFLGAIAIRMSPAMANFSSVYAHEWQALVMLYAAGHSHVELFCAAYNTFMLKHAQRRYDTGAPSRSAFPMVASVVQAAVASDCVPILHLIFARATRCYLARHSRQNRDVYVLEGGEKDFCIAVAHCDTGTRRYLDAAVACDGGDSGGGESRRAIVREHLTTAAQRDAVRLIERNVRMFAAVPGEAPSVQCQ